MGRRIREGLSKERRELVDQLKLFCSHLGSGRRQTLVVIVDRLKRGYGYSMGGSTLSKVLSGDIFPEYRLVSALRDLACEDAGADAVGITAEELESLYWKAKDARCPACAGHVRRVRELEKQAKSCHKFHIDVRFPLSASATPAQLPVPLFEGDRQRSELAAAVDELTEKAAGALADGRQEDALALIAEIPERLDAPAVATCVTAFRGREEHSLAETLLQLYGREQPERQVIRLALQLQESGRISDAGAAMRASVG